MTKNDKMTKFRLKIKVFILYRKNNFSKNCFCAYEELFI